jgi:hypothetical protein
MNADGFVVTLAQIILKPVVVCSIGSNVPLDKSDGSECFGRQAVRHDMIVTDCLGR